MELNHCCPDFDEIKIPLITNMHYDSEGGGSYKNIKKATGVPYGSGYCYPTGSAIDPSSGELQHYTQNETNFGGLGQIVGQGYQKYLFNRYMPAESLPDWRTGNASPWPSNMTPNYGANVPNMWDHVNNTEEKLWDTAKPWNANQQRNFSYEPTGKWNDSTYVRGTHGGFANDSYDYSSRDLGSSYDGIQRYKYGYIAMCVSAQLNLGSSSQGAQGMIQGFCECYNIGENQPPGVFQIPKLKDRIPGPVYPPDSFQPTNKDFYQATNFDTKSYFETSNNYGGLPPPNHGNVIDNSTCSLGSGTITGSFCPDCPNEDNNFYTCNGKYDANKGKVVAECSSIECVSRTWKQNTITNPIMARIWNAYHQPKLDNGEELSFLDFMGNNQVDPRGISPAISDLYQRFAAKNAGITPPDGRGWKDPSMVVGVVPEPSKTSDGWYCPIDASYVTLNGSERGTINLSLLGSNYTDGTGQVVNGNKIGEDDQGGSRENPFGPQGSVFTLQTCLKGATLTLDPRIPGPPPPEMDATNQPAWPGVSDTLAGAEPGYPKAPDWAPGISGDKKMFTVRDQLVSTYIFGKMIDCSFNLGWIQVNGMPAPAESPYRINYKVKDTKWTKWCKNLTYNTEWIKSTWAIDPDDEDSCWNKKGICMNDCNKYGDNTNAVGVLQDATHPHHCGFVYFKQFAKAMGTIMCGKENSHKAKIGLYSIEFLPMNWLINPDS